MDDLSPSPVSPVERTKPAVLRFSLYYPWAEADSHESILPYVTTPIKELLCANKVYLISSKINGRNLCPQQSLDSQTQSKFQMNDPYFGNPEYSVLIETPAFVEESTLGDVHWTSWTIAFYVVQLGLPLMDMTAQMMEGGDSNNNAYHSSGTSSEISDLQVSEVMNNVLQLALQVSISEGDMDQQMSQNLPGAHVSMMGEEVSTWVKYGIFSDDDLALYYDGSSSSQNPPQHSLMDDSPITAASHIDGSNDNNAPNSIIPSRTGPSIIATSMMESHTLRHIGFGMFGTMLVVWVILIRFGIRRREERQKKYELQQKAAAAHNNEREQRSVQLATEDDVSMMLRVGKQVLHHHDSPTVMRIDSYSRRGEENQVCLA